MKITLNRELVEALSNNETRDQLSSELDERFASTSTDSSWVYVRDFGDDPTGWVVFEVSGKGAPLDAGLYQLDYTITDDVVELDAGDPVEMISKTSYEPKPTTTDTSEALVGDVVPLVESALRRDGTIPVKVMAPGWSANGRYYGADILERDGSTAFPTGTHMYWDHPTATEAADRPERSLRDLSAITVSDARFDENGPAGAGLYADAKVLADYAPAVEELAPHIGVSIRAEGAVSYGEAEGQSGQIVEGITVGRSIDFVTTPAAGGEIVSLFEAVRASGHRPPKKERPMPENTDLTEAQRKLTEAEQLGAWAAAERDRDRAELTKLREAGVLRDATTAVTEALAKEPLPDITKTRLVREIAGNPPLTESGELDKVKLAARFDEAVKQAKEEHAAITGGGTVIGLGESLAPLAVDEATTTSALEQAFGRMGLSESAAKSAAAGR